MSNLKKIRYVLLSFLIFELISGIQWGVHRGLSSLFAKHILSITSFTQIGIIVSIFGISKAITNLLFGAISDRLGRKPVILVGIVLTGVGRAIIGSSTEYVTMLIGTAFIGIGGGARALCSGRTGACKHFHGEEKRYIRLHTGAHRILFIQPSYL